MPCVLEIKSEVIEQFAKYCDCDISYPNNIYTFEKCKTMLKSDFNKNSTDIIDFCSMAPLETMLLDYDDNECSLILTNLPKAVLEVGQYKEVYEIKKSDFGAMIFHFNFSKASDKAKRNTSLLVSLGTMDSENGVIMIPPRIATSIEIDDINIAYINTNVYPSKMKYLPIKEDFNEA